MQQPTEYEELLRFNAASLKFIKWNEKEEQQKAFHQKNDDLEMLNKPIDSCKFHETHEKSVYGNTLSQLGWSENVENDVKAGNSKSDAKKKKKKSDVKQIEDAEKKEDVEKAENVKKKEDDKKAEETMRRHLGTLAKKQAYVPKGVQKSWRLRLCVDLSKGLETYPVPVFCDMNTMSSDVIFTDNFRYITKNEFKDQVLLKESEEPIQKCNCTGPCETASCSCIRLHHFVNEDYPVVCKKGRIKPLKPMSDLYTYVLIVCGDKCGCPKTCPNRMENIVARNRFEVFRRHLNLGFGVRTLTSIRIGQVVMEFTGRVIPQAELYLPKIGRENDTRREDYAYELYNPQEYKLVLQDKFKKHTASRISEDVWKKIFENLDTQFLDPYSFGNVARFCSCSCLPNMSPIRVVANYLHPARHHIFMVATAPIAAGTELTIDYGAAYRNRCKYNCLCDSPLCSSGPLKDMKQKVPLPKVLEGVTGLYNEWKIESEKNDDDVELLCQVPDGFDWEASRLSVESDVQEEPKELRRRGELYLRHPVRDNDADHSNNANQSPDRADNVDQSSPVGSLSAEENSINHMSPGGDPPSAQKNDAQRSSVSRASQGLCDSGFIDADNEIQIIEFHQTSPVAGTSFAQENDTHRSPVARPSKRISDAGFIDSDDDIEIIEVINRSPVAAPSSVQKNDVDHSPVARPSKRRSDVGLREAKSHGKQHRPQSMEYSWVNSPSGNLHISRI